MKSNLKTNIPQLQRCQQLFDIPKDTIYLAGHSLGPKIKGIEDILYKAILQEWGNGLVCSWNDAEWITLPERAGAKIAAIIGARSEEVIVADSTSINLFKCLGMALRIQSKRMIILAENNAFPADLYIAQAGASLLRGACLKTVDPLQIIDAIDEHTAVVMVSHVDYKDSTIVNLKQLTQVAHQYGVLVLADLSHSAGIMPININELGIDFAVGCGYKYLNGGPGAPAFIYVARRHQGKVNSPLTGWMGHRDAFAFKPHYESSGTIRDMLCGTPPIISMRLLEESLKTFEGLNMYALQDESHLLSQILYDQINTNIPQLEIISNSNPYRRGGHIAIRHSHAYAIKNALRECKVICDYRPPDIIRLGISPLYICETNLNNAVEKLIHIMHQQLYLNPKYEFLKKVN